MNDNPNQADPERGLNPGLRQRTETIHDTKHPTRPPAESASVQRDETGAWPMVWLIVTILGVAVAIWLLFF